MESQFVELSSRVSTLEEVVNQLVNWTNNFKPIEIKLMKSESGQAAVEVESASLADLPEGGFATASNSTSRPQSVDADAEPEEYFFMEGDSDSEPEQLSESELKVDVEELNLNLNLNWDDEDGNSDKNDNDNENKNKEFGTVENSEHAEHKDKDEDEGESKLWLSVSNFENSDNAEHKDNDHDQDESESHLRLPMPNEQEDSSLKSTKCNPEPESVQKIAAGGVQGGNGNGSKRRTRLSTKARRLAGFGDQKNLSPPVVTLPQPKPKFSKFSNVKLQSKKQTSKNEERLRSMYKSKPATATTTNSSIKKSKSSSPSGNGRRNKVAGNEQDSDYACPLCHKTMKNKHNLKRHIKLHSGEKPFECSLCSKKFFQKWNLKIHIERTHTNELPVNCNLCPRKFANVPAMKQHVTRVHIVASNKCYFCGKRTRYPADLSQHSRTHTGERPFMCSKCAYDSNCRSALIKHVKKEHPENPA